MSKLINIQKHSALNRKTYWHRYQVTYVILKNLKKIILTYTVNIEVLAFVWNAKRSAVAWVLLLLFVTLPAVCRISESAITGISDLALTWKATFVMTSSSHQKMGSAISKKSSSVRQGLSLEKSWLWSPVVQCEN